MIVKKKHRDYLIVDGYNVINAWTDLKEIADNNLEEARDRLDFMMEEYASYKGVFAIVVYDAYRVRSVSRREREGKNLRIVYTKENQTADSYIEKLITELGPKRHLNIAIATDDMAEQQIVLGKGGSRISTRELRIETDRIKQKIESKTAKTFAQKNTLDHRIDKEVLEKLEAIRKSRH